MRTVLAVVFLVHALAHLPGFMVPWRLLDSREMPYGTTLLGGAVDVGSGGVKVVGLLWLGAGIAMAAVALMTLRGRPGWPAFALGVVVSSLGLCVAQWPASRIGAAVNLVLLAVLVIDTRIAWLSS